jgi:flagellar hook-length control protein FliK
MNPTPALASLPAILVQAQDKASPPSMRQSSPIAPAGSDIGAFEAELAALADKALLGASLAGSAGPSGAGSADAEAAGEAQASVMAPRGLQLVPQTKVSRATAGSSQPRQERAKRRTKPDRSKQKHIGAVLADKAGSTPQQAEAPQALGAPGPSSLPPADPRGPDKTQPETKRAQPEINEPEMKTASPSSPRTPGTQAPAPLPQPLGGAIHEPTAKESALPTSDPTSQLAPEPRRTNPAHKEALLRPAQAPQAKAETNGLAQMSLVQMSLAKPKEPIGDRAVPDVSAAVSSGSAKARVALGASEPESPIVAWKAPNPFEAKAPAPAATIQPEGQGGSPLPTLGKVPKASFEQLDPPRHKGVEQWATLTRHEEEAKAALEDLASAKPTLSQTKDVVSDRSPSSSAKGSPAAEQALTEASSPLATKQAGPPLRSAEPIHLASAWEQALVAPPRATEPTPLPAGSPSPPEPAQSLPTQIVEVISPMLTKGQTTSISLALHPPELGSIQIHMELRPEGLVVHIYAENPTGEAALRQALPELRHEISSGSTNAWVDLGSWSERPGRDDSPPPPPPRVRQDEAEEALATPIRTTIPSHTQRLLDIHI